jgi:hypothetical protein
MAGPAEPDPRSRTAAPSLRMAPERPGGNVTEAAGDTFDRSATFDQWAILELMGHRQLGGRVREQEVAGYGMLRVDIYPGDAARPIATQFYNPRSVYGLHPVDEQVARAYAARSSHEPAQRWQLPEPLYFVGDEPDDEDGLTP